MLKQRILFILILFSVSFNSLAGPFKNISDTELIKLQKDTSYIVIDLRTPAEVKKTGTIPGAVVKNFRDPDFSKYIKDLDRKKKYIVYCHSGGRSASAASKMSDLGLKTFNYGGGITGWISNKNDIDRR